MRWLLSALALAVLAAPIVLSASPARAAEEIELSHDGDTWGESLTMPLFDADTLWVPGDEQTVSFHVRNQGQGQAALTVEVQPTDTDSLLADEHIELAVRTQGSDWQNVRNGDPVSVRMPADLAIEEAAEVELHAVFDPESSNASQRGEVSLDVVVTLSGDVPDGGDEDDVPPDAGDVPPDAGDGLPGTGIGGPWWVLWCAATLLIIGLLARRQLIREVTGG